MARLSTISFFDTVDANSNKTLVSKRITQKFTIKRIQASFALNTNRTLKLRFFISDTLEAPTTKQPEGLNVLKQLGQVDYIVGDDEPKDFEIEIREFTKGARIKIYAENIDAFEHTIDCQVTIQLITAQDLLGRIKEVLHG